MTTQIHFIQAEFITNEQDKIAVYVERYYEMLRTFTKSPFLQLRQWDLYQEISDLATAYYEKDYSKFLFRKTDEVSENSRNLSMTLNCNSYRQ